MKLHFKKFNKLVDAIYKDENWFEEFMELCEKYYEKNCCGGSLHVVLDDGNLGSKSVTWCAGYAAGKEDDAGSDLANLMLHMSIKQKRKVYKKLRN